MSSKADDFDVRYRDAGAAEYGRQVTGGGYRGMAGEVDYDLGYDAEGWDTQGFRRPEAGFPDSHSRAAAPATGTQETGRLGWDAEATGALLTPELPRRSRRAGGPGGPGRPRGPWTPRPARTPWAASPARAPG